ncbi:hypothetical protein PR048_025984 [Dryococelus australis]|uniref:Uncharacterized protein n=1 Tax=Dryococelus australis TaxID=614101 RepID=A0ABQ9GK36_9NEOP|nr:hypothetical protein PR048_025984 [Dryococelus australis]
MFYPINLQHYGGCSGLVVRLLASHLGVFSASPVGSLLDFHVGILPDDAAGWPIFSGIFSFSVPFTPALLHTHLTSPSSALKTSMLRRVEIFGRFLTSSFRAEECETSCEWRSTGLQGHRKLEIPKKTHPPARCPVQFPPGRGLNPVHICGRQAIKLLSHHSLKKFPTHFYVSRLVYLIDIQNNAVMGTALKIRGNSGTKIYLFRAYLIWRHGGGAIILLASHRSGFNPQPGHSGFSHVGIVPDDAIDRRVFSGISHLPRPFILAPLHTHLNHPLNTPDVKSCPNFFKHSPYLTCELFEPADSQGSRSGESFVGLDNSVAKSASLKAWQACKRVKDIKVGGGPKHAVTYLQPRRPGHSVSGTTASPLQKQKRTNSTAQR